MLDSLVPGLENTKTSAITEDMCTGHTGTPVLSTPSMIGLMEGTCLESAQEHLGATEVTVGSTSASPTSPARRSARRSPSAPSWPRSSVAGSSPTRCRPPSATALLGEGTHKRAVLDTARMKK